ncbi:MAG TPA: hypothetical protein VLG76_01705 [Rhabdochlamydiaceae bacterium]|nr:hypothetical protein [Rhabdochlamydiaceae bacterium]
MKKKRRKTRTSKVLRKKRKKSSLKSAASPSKKIKKRPPFPDEEEEGQRRLGSHWDRGHKTKKGWGIPPHTYRYMQDYISPESRHWQQVQEGEGDYGYEGKNPSNRRYNDQSPEEKRHRKEEADPHRGYGRDLQDIEDEDADDEHYFPGQKTS